MFCKIIFGNKIDLFQARFYNTGASPVAKVIKDFMIVNFSLPPGASGGIQTLGLRIMCQVFHHCATGVQQITLEIYGRAKKTKKNKNKNSLHESNTKFLITNNCMGIQISCNNLMKLNEAST